MDKQGRHIFAALIIVLLIVAAITAWITVDFSDDDAPASDAPSAAPLPSDTPSDDPQQSEDPSTAPSPTPTPAQPSQTVPQGERLLTGSFDSDTGCTLNTHTEWAVTVSGDGKYIMEVKVYLRSFTVGIGPRTGCISILGTDYRFSTEAISIESNSQAQEVLLGAASHELPLDPGELLSVPISVTWNFAGVYSGNDIDNIDSQTTITIQG